MTVGLLAYMHKRADRLSEKKVIVVIALAALASLLLATARIGLYGYVVIFVMYAGEHVLYPFMSEVLNSHAPENKRATVLSVASFLRMLPYVVLAPIIGALNDRDKLEYFLVVWALLIGLAVAIYLSKKKRDAQIALGS